jgi:2-succinyl-5-enolpyruvyl-6-hydroxy-3-cyclohexene-1-carboxylate synthase
MQNSLESRWAEIIIDQLVDDQHNYFCISPGSRSTPLILAIASNKKAKSFVHFDERSLAFHALGYSKVAKNAPIIVVTSGTACGNLLPAIMESFESCSPLIILTADRPPEMQDTGANQTTKHQPSLYKNFVCYEINLSVPDEKCFENLKHLVHRCSYLLKKHKKSVHINCSFREPFNLDSHDKTSSSYSLISYQLPRVLPTCIAQEIGLILNQAQKGLILLGSEALKHQDQTTFHYLSEHLKWPVFSDALSLWEKNEYTIYHYNLLLKSHLDLSCLPEELSFDCILHIGGSFVSKHLPVFLKATRPKFYIHVHSVDHRYDPTHLVTHKLEIEPESFCKDLIPYLEVKEKKSMWFALDQFIRNFLTTFFVRSQKNTEPNFFWLLSENIPKNCCIFIGNSMPIRDLSDMFCPKSFSWKIYANRGLSGIDGNIATAAGITQVLNTPCIIIVGDQTFLHDATSISQLKNRKNPIKLVVLDNSGGQIFSHLPIYKHKNICEKYFINHTNFHIQGFATAFQIPFYSFECVQDFFQSNSLLHSKDSCIIHIRTDPSCNLSIHKQLSCEIKDAISSFFCTL